MQPFGVMVVFICFHCTVRTNPLCHKGLKSFLKQQPILQWENIYCLRTFFGSKSVSFKLNAKNKKLGKKNKVSFFVRIQVHRNDNPLEYDNITWYAWEISVKWLIIVTLKTQRSVPPRVFKDTMVTLCSL